MGYKILSKNVYRGTPFVSSAPKISPKDYRSMNSLPITLTSYGYGEGNKPLIYGTDGCWVAAHRTANKVVEIPLADFNKYGSFSPQLDDISGYGKWKSAGEDVKPNMFDYVPKMPDIAYITRIAPSPMRFPDSRDTNVDLRTTKEIANAVEPNKVGYFTSKLANRYEECRNLMWDYANRYKPEAVAWIDFLAKKGFSLDKSKKSAITGTGIQVDVANEGYMASYYPKERYLTTEVDFHSRAEKLISKYGLSGREAVGAEKRAVLLHEIAHRLGVGGDRASERLQGMLRAEFYSKLAENSKGTKMERVYRALAKEGEDYARAHSYLSILDGIQAGASPKGKSQLELLIGQFEKEAKALELKGKKKSKHVRTRLNEVYGQLLSSESSYKENEKHPDSKRGLEEMAGDEYYNSDKETETYGKIAPSDYKSMSDAKNSINEARETKRDKAEIPERLD